MHRSALFVALASVALLVAPNARAEEPLFGRHVTPLLYRLGCSAGQCHGAFAGKGGFRLSLFASSPDTDFLNVRGPFGRRIDTVQPEKSLFLLKPTGAIEHGGGVRLKRDGPEYRVLKKWIEAGARFDPRAEAKVVAVRVEPGTITLSPGATPQAAKVVAKLANGKEENVTGFTRFESLDAGIAEVDGEGKVTARRPGDAAILAHYGGEIGFANVLVPGSLSGGLKFPDEKLADRVDVLLGDKLRKLNIVPSPVCDDLEFLRRVYLDTIGVLPEPSEIRQFLADKTPDKRAKLIDRLLVHPYHAALWAGKLCDMIGADDRFIGNGVYQFHDWFRNKIEQNTPWDQIAHGVICATAADGRSPEAIREDQKREAELRKKKQVEVKTGDKPWQAGYALRDTLDVFYGNLINQQVIPSKGRIVDSRKIALRVAHTFLGVRLECAQCHKHPYDRYSQSDFLSFAAAFSFVEFGADPELKIKKVNLAGTHVASKPAETFHDPDTGAEVSPRLLAGAGIKAGPGLDPRQEVWKWMVSADNPFFARAIVNRIWEHYLGHGFFEPADAQAAANPPSHPEVLDELVKDFVQSKYDLRKLERRILNLVAYQRDWRTNATNAKDERNFSHRTLRRLTAEQALDAVAQVTSTPIKLPKRFADFRDGVRAVEIAMSRVGGDDGYLLTVFGKPLRVQNCDCERSPAASLSQTLYFYNDEKLVAKISDPKGRLTKLVSEINDDRKLVEELYLLALTRFPTSQEVDRSLAYLRDVSSRTEAYQDLLWSLMNRHEFIVNH
jgi:hypothetical protein